MRCKRVSILTDHFFGLGADLPVFGALLTGRPMAMRWCWGMQSLSFTVVPFTE